MATPCTRTLFKLHAPLEEKTMKRRENSTDVLVKRIQEGENVVVHSYSIICTSMMARKSTDSKFKIIKVGTVVRKRMYGN